jgi:hypothetical protein
MIAPMKRDMELSISVWKKWWNEVGVCICFHGENQVFNRIGTEKVSSTRLRLAVKFLNIHLQPWPYHQPSIYAIAMGVIVATKSIIVKADYLSSSRLCIDFESIG